MAHTSSASTKQYLTVNAIRCIEGVVRNAFERGLDNKSVLDLEGNPVVLPAFQAVSSYGKIVAKATSVSFKRSEADTSTVVEVANHKLALALAQNPTIQAVFAQLGTTKEAIQLIAGRLVASLAPYQAQVATLQAKFEQQKESSRDARVLEALANLKIED